MLRSQGAAVSWCDCRSCPYHGDEEETVSVFDDGRDLAETPQLPPEETRGGEHIDWDHAVPGEPLPELPEPPAGPRGITDLDGI